MMLKLNMIFSISPNIGQKPYTIKNVCAVKSRDENAIPERSIGT